MSAVAMLVGVALATTAAIAILISMVNGQLPASEPTQLNGNETNGHWIDPNGPSVQFVLFTRNSSPYNIRIGNIDDLRNSGFNISHSVKILIHGYQSSIKEAIFVITKDAYLETGDYNVIGMDWSVLCQSEYFSALRGVKIAGYYLGVFLSWLVQMGVPLANVHLVGHSMGAHVAGIGGASIKYGRVARITGLDPAKPGYRHSRYENRLDPGDAVIVDVIHTHAKILSLSEPVGHIDFYPNGGRTQPGCPDMEDIWQIVESLICSHGRAISLFAESIKNKRAFKSYKCETIEDAIYGICSEETDVYMGQSETYRKGIFYVQTKDKSPYSLT
ncbi:unnamed protein product [Phaedon cochleariae]|uniref:Lipase domain-containing protein n=1 Tax=Phaedon cochleariae TaxID=80249 RepID=A0A9P0DYM5_PHACE|nr:unnamed protein product [Phaedon cochleariae]